MCVCARVELPSVLAYCQSAHRVASHLGYWCSQEEQVVVPNPDSDRIAWRGVGKFKLFKYDAGSGFFVCIGTVYFRGIWKRKESSI